MNETTETLTIGGLAKAAGVNVETIRFYQRKGLMREPDRPPGGIRRYGEADLARVRFIKSAQRLWFSLDEVGDLLKLEDGSHCTETRPSFRFSRPQRNGIAAIYLGQVAQQPCSIAAHYPTFLPKNGPASLRPSAPQTQTWAAPKQPGIDETGQTA
jgi:DNA-binding transcriptional MerR regulator